ncbi:MAG: alpha/beta fold hydrolase [Alphaproteobacteria bacterium]|nr:alpha/beta fold hydrolase [Alphaproteobacteria bacterium]
MNTASRREVLGVIAGAAQPIANDDSGRVSDAVPAVAAGETFAGTWPFTARYATAPGFRMHYVDEGAGPETFLLLHGEPTWSYLYRQQIPLWARLGRVIAVDHMGFGKSAAPQNRTYWLQDHIDNLERFVLAEDLRDLTLVMHDFGGPTGMGLAIRHPGRIKRIVSVNGPTPLGQPDLIDRLTANAGDAPWFQWIMEAERDGVLDDVLGQLDYNILSTLKLNGFERNEIITDTWLKAYRAPFPTRAHAAGAIGWAKGFANGDHVFETPDAATKAALATKPALALWGTADRTLHAKHFLPLFEQAFPNGTTRRLTGAGHYSLEDAPGETARRVAQFVTA